MSPNAALALATETTMTIQSDLLGELDVTKDELITFAHGLFGFPECKSFVLVQAAREGLYWLQSTEHSALAFLLADPFLFFDGYSVDLGDKEEIELRAREASEVAILSIVTLPRSPEEQATANLQGPLALNLRVGLGKQLALGESVFGFRCPIDLTGAAAG